MSPRTHLLLLFDAAAWGRAALAINMAIELQQLGDRVRFIAHRAQCAMLRRAGFDVEEVSESLGLLHPLLIQECVRETAAASLILCDLSSCAQYLERCGVDIATVHDCGAPVLAMDIWDSLETPQGVDVIGRIAKQRHDWNGEQGSRLVPVPIGRFGSPDGYCALPQATRQLPPRATVRGERTVLFCTAPWQHQMRSDEGRRVAREVPKLLAHYLQSVSPHIRLVHVGPEPLALDDDAPPYEWRGTVGASEFDALLAGTDLLLSANVSGTTMARAVAARVPVLVIENSRELTSADAGQSPAVRRWLERAAPVHPFSLWPLGYYTFLKPLMDGNPYRDTFLRAELIDEQGVIDGCARLLFDATAQRELADRQSSYANRVAELPTAADRIHAFLARAS